MAQLRFDLHHQPLGAHRNDLVLQSLLAMRGLHDAFQPGGHVFVRLPDLSAKQPEGGRGAVQHFAPQADTRLDAALDVAELRDACRQSR